MSKKHDPIIHAAIIQAAATLASGIMMANATRGLGSTGYASAFAEALEAVETKYDAHLTKHHEK
ncbi:hypothetical protein NKW45_05780 [Acetobacter orientalis]|uniref:hypothetical protein n=1 Tax=Acetobacter orientalis TaxID=146474 RepID=UPI0020A3E3F3|nr:hypothetical protein [Acetobacter orientalis]MCP1221356.1 hypothetical protein [Acetobacter orientalis]